MILNILSLILIVSWLSLFFIGKDGIIIGSILGALALFAIGLAFLCTWLDTPSKQETSK